MKQTIDLYAFREAFRHANRYYQFGYEALEILFDYLEEIDPDFDLDVIALCCDYAHDTVEEIAEQYDIDLSECECEDEDEKREAVRAWLYDHTSTCGETETGFVYCSSF